MSTMNARKAAIRDFKEKKPSIGVYAIRSSVSMHVWVGTSRNLEAMKNSCWFQLRNKLHREKSLQEKWDAQGETAFEYEILDRLDEDVQALNVDDQLKSKKQNWVVRLNAQQLL